MPLKVLYSIQTHFNFVPFYVYLAIRLNQTYEQLFDAPFKAYLIQMPGQFQYLGQDKTVCYMRLWHSLFRAKICYSLVVATYCQFTLSQYRQNIFALRSFPGSGYQSLNYTVIEHLQFFSTVNREGILTDVFAFPTCQAL